MDASERLARIGQLLAGLPGPYGNEHLWTLIRFAEHATAFPAVFEFLRDCEVIDAADSDGVAPQAPQDATELAPLLWEADGGTAIEVLTGLTCRTLAYRVQGRYSAEKARGVFGRLRMLMGPECGWWTNTTLTSWNPVTRHTFDALVVGAGGGVLVAVLAVDED